MANFNKNNSTKNLLSSEQILTLFEGRADNKNSSKTKASKVKSLNLEQILQLLGAERKHKRFIENILYELIEQGKLIRIKGQAYAKLENLILKRGTLSIQRQGMGFVTLENYKGDDIYIHPTQLNGAWHGDTVKIAILPKQSGKSLEGRVLSVVERGRKELMVQVMPDRIQEKGETKFLTRPIDRRIFNPLKPIYVWVGVKDLEVEPKVDDLLLVELLPLKEQSNNDGVIRANARAILDGKNDLGLHEQMIKANHGIATEFSMGALAECEKLPDEPDLKLELSLELGKAKITRKDLRDLAFVTIDGEDARDFDDAICVIKQENGFKLYVAIADVDNYVKAGSSLDLEALNRGNSCYFPASVEPMLPQRLSNGLCSLKPNVPRLVMVAEIDFNKNAQQSSKIFYPAIIQSKARLTYNEVQRLFTKNIDENASSSELKAELLAQAEMLFAAQELAEQLINKRAARGSLDFELPEAQVELTEDKQIKTLSFQKRLFAHRLIEEFMIAANEATAEYLGQFADQGLSFLYRTHAEPNPDKISELYDFIAQLGYDVSMPTEISPITLQELLKITHGKNDEFVINRLLLRSLMQARYNPDPDGHFGLASTAYCHFTSPIRRYADLTVHRALKFSLGILPSSSSSEDLSKTAEHINFLERNAVEAERDTHKVCAALYLQDKLEQKFSGIISGVSSFGIFVELTSLPVEGFVPLEYLPDDYYNFDNKRHLLLGSHSGLLFRLGQKINIVVDKVDPFQLQITFSLADFEKKPKTLNNQTDGRPSNRLGNRPDRKAKGKDKTKKPENATRARNKNLKKSSNPKSKNRKK